MPFPRPGRRDAAPPPEFPGDLPRTRPIFAGPSPDQHRTELAVPLEPAEASALKDALRATDVLARAKTSGSGGLAHDLASVLLTDAGTASALDHQTVPLLVNHIRIVDSAVREVERLAPDQPNLDKFRIVRDKLHALAGVARVKNWTARVTDSVEFGALPTCCWTDDAPFATQTSMPHLIAGPDHGGA